MYGATVCPLTSRCLGVRDEGRELLRGSYLVGCLVAVVSLWGSFAEAQESDDRPQALRVFLDCNRCDRDYLRREITFVNWVRDRRDA